MMMRQVGRKPLGRDMMKEGREVPRMKAGSAASPVVEGSRQLKTQMRSLSFEGSESGKWYCKGQVQPKGKEEIKK